jgi:hypothetical protein
MSTISVVEGEDLSVYVDGEDESPKSDAMKTKKPQARRRFAGVS